MTARMAPFAPFDWMTVWPSSWTGSMAGRGGWQMSASAHDRCLSSKDTVQHDKALTEAVFQ